MDGGGAYGVGKATGRFDPVAYAKKPEVILRAVSWVRLCSSTYEPNVARFLCENPLESMRTQHSHSHETGAEGGSSTRSRHRHTVRVSVPALSVSLSCRCSCPKMSIVTEQ